MPKWPSNAVVSTEGADGKQRLETNLQDVSSIFLYHLTALGVVFGLATIILTGYQVYGNMQDAKRNEERRQEQARRDEDAAGREEDRRKEQARRDEEQDRRALDHAKEQEARDTSYGIIMQHTGTLILNMAHLVSSTQKTLDSTADVREMLAQMKSDVENAKRRLKDESIAFVKNHSINMPSIASDVRAKFHDLALIAPKVPEKDHPPAYGLLRALHSGCALSRSSEAVAILDTMEREVGQGRPPLEAELLPRSFYFRGHFSIRIGDFNAAQKYFEQGFQQLNGGNDNYRLFALYARLMNARHQKSVLDEASLIADFKKFWDERITASNAGSLELGKTPHRHFWEHLGHSYAALLAEGLCPEVEDYADKSTPDQIRARLNQASEVVDTVDRRQIGAEDENPISAFDAVRFEIKLREARLDHDGGKLMSGAELEAALERCRHAADSNDIRARIVYTIRLARFAGRLAAVHPSSDPHTNSALAQMSHWKGEAIRLIRGFNNDADKSECVYSVFTNLYERPEKIRSALEADVIIGKYRSERLMSPPAAP